MTKATLKINPSRRALLRGAVAVSALAAPVTIAAAAGAAPVADPLPAMERERRRLAALANAAETNDDLDKFAASNAVDEAMVEITATTLAGALAKVRVAYEGYLEDPVCGDGIGDRLMVSAIEDLEQIAGVRT
jgi:hypothetical protein